MNLGENIKKIRKDNHLSQEELADKLNVSRQSVSKWENGDAYPEMDKMVQICNMFNINIDDLINNDIKEVNNTREAKNNINKFVDSFLEYITKTINMFSSLKFGQKLKCLFEQLFIVLALFFGFAMLRLILGAAVNEIISLFPSSVYRVISSILSSIYAVGAIFIGVILVLHIFKIRYLDYYQIIDTPKELDTKELEQKIINTDNKKIIIRDPNHSGYRFIKGLFKIFLVLFKVYCAFLILQVAFLLVCFVALLVLSFLFAHTGLTFVGSFIGLLGGIIICALAIIILFDFIFNRNTKFGRVLIIFIISIISIGLGLGLFFTGLSTFSIIDNIEEYEYQEKEIVMDYKSDMFVSDDIEFIEGDNKNLKIIVKYAPNYKVDVKNSNGHIHISTNCENPNEFKNLLIKDINKKKIVSYSDYKVTITTSKENIAKMKKNYETYQDTIKTFEEQLRQEQEKNSKLELRVQELELQVKKETSEN